MHDYTLHRFFPYLQKKLKFDEGDLFPNQLSYMMLIHEYNKGSNLGCRFRTLNRLTGNSNITVAKVVKHLQGLGYVWVDDRGKGRQNTIHLTNLGFAKLQEYVKFFECLALGKWDFEEHKPIADL